MSDLATLTEEEAKKQARAHLHAGVPLAARRLLEPFVRNRTTDVETYALFGQACIDANDLADAQELLSQAPADDSDAARQASLRLAQVQLLQNRTLEAIERLAGLAMADPSNRDILETLAFALLQQGDSDRALILFGEACRRFPLTPRLAVGMMKALAAQGNFDAALEFAEEADRLIPGHSGILLEWCRILIQAKRLDEAETKLRRSLRDIGPTKEVAVMLANIFLIKDRQADARKYFRMALRLDPTDESLRHLAYDEVGKQGERASDAYVAGLFDNYATKFEASLIGLGYRVPGLLRKITFRRLDEKGGPSRLGDMLDLGCGTGLLGVVLHDVKAGFWQGIDLSKEMIEEARRKNIYDDLRIAEITSYLKEDDRIWDSIFAADVFCYFGDLSEVFELILARSRPGGFFAFSVEALSANDGRSWTKTATGRYAHGYAYIKALTSRAKDVEIIEDVLRMDRDLPVQGLLVTGFAP